MIEPELKVELDQINQKLESMDRALNPSRWRMFVQGLWRAVGYIIGIVIAALILGCLKYDWPDSIFKRFLTRGQSSFRNG